MYVWRDKLVGGLPVIFDGVVVVISGFVVQDLMICDVACFLEASPYSSMCGDVLVIMVMGSTDT